MTLGIERYGQPLYSNDGRNTTADLVQEPLDALLYAHKGAMAGNATCAGIREHLFYFLQMIAEE